MPPTVVTIALISYSIAILTEQRKKLVINRVLIFLTLGVLLDISCHHHDDHCIGEQSLYPPWNPGLLITDLDAYRCHSALEIPDP